MLFLLYYIFLCIIGTEHTLKSFIFVVVLIWSRRRPVLNAHIDVMWNLPHRKMDVGTCVVLCKIRFMLIYLQPIQYQRHISSAMQKKGFYMIPPTRLEYINQKIIYNFTYRVSRLNKILLSH